ncbi:MAG: ABC transporter permease subunit [Anaerolineaceae bacterium]|nr:ABC transporter permease subunit [Anaerolineaceae bacterium]
MQTVPSSVNYRSSRGAVFIETLRQNWKQVLYWGIGCGAMGFFTISLLPYSGFLEAYQKIIEMLPPQVYQAFLGEDTAFAATPEGYLSGEFFSWIVLMYALYAVIAGLNVSANEEESGILDVLLSLPLPRWRMVIEKAAAYTLIITGMVFLSFLGLWGGELTAHVLTIETERLAETVFNMLPSVLMVLGFTIFAGTVFRRRSTVARVGGAIIVGSFFLEFMGGMASQASLARAISVISFYHYYDPAGVIQHGFNWGNIAILLVASILLLAAAVWRFQRRDLGV